MEKFIIYYLFTLFLFIYFIFIYLFYFYLFILFLFIYLFYIINLFYYILIYYFLWCLFHRCKGRRPLGKAWLRVGAIIAEFNMGSYGLRADSARPQRVSGSARTDSRHAESTRNPIPAHVEFGVREHAPLC